jgi:hypothetical protein
MGSLLDTFMLATMLGILLWEIAWARNLRRKRRQVTHVGNRRLWDAYITAARDHGLLGPPRLESRGGHLMLVGMGLCQWLPSRVEGIQMLDGIRSEIDFMMDVAEGRLRDRTATKHRKICVV